MRKVLIFVRTIKSKLTIAIKIITVTIMVIVSIILITIAIQAIPTAQLAYGKIIYKPSAVVIQAHSCHTGRLNYGKFHSLRIP